jgi:hypothetical protein
MHWFGFRLTAAAVLFASLLVGSLVATPTANAAITGSTITTPTDPTYLVTPLDSNGAPTGTFAIAGTTSGGDPSTDQVDILCYYGTTFATVASGVPLNPDGSFSLPSVSINPVWNTSGICRLRAVPAGTQPADLTPFAGPRVTVTGDQLINLSGGPNDGQLYSAYLYAQQLTGAFDYTTLGGDSGANWGLLYDGWLFDATMTATTNTFYSNAGLLRGESPSPTRSELQIDGANAYPVAAAAIINPNASGLPALTHSSSVDPATGNLVIHETDPLVKCTDPTYPPTTTSCASFVSAGVTDTVTITQDHDGHIAWVTNVFTSTDGLVHSLDLLWDNHQHFQNGGLDSTLLEYQFPGESVYSTHPVADAVTLPASSPGAILIRMNGAADGDTSTGQGAIVYDRPATEATFTDVNSTFSEFILHQTGTVPAAGSTRFRFAYVQDYLAGNVASLAQTASTAFLNRLSVAKSGNGSGTVTSSVAGISCGASCSHGYPYGTTVTLTATPSTGSTFTGWSGACIGKGTCTVTTNDATSVRATFSLVPETLTVSKSGTGSGTVRSSVAGISCGSACAHSYLYGTSVSLTATPSTGSTFVGWSGACAGRATCRVTMTRATSVRATFSLVPEMLTVSKRGDGKGTVTSLPAGISCGAICSHAYNYGSAIILNAKASKGSSFAGWAGACTGKAACTLSMSAARSVRATFLKDCFVPRVAGKGLKAAKRAIRARHCGVGKIAYAASSKVKKGRVISQKPRPGKHLKRGAKVRLVVSKGTR